MRDGADHRGGRHGRCCLDRRPRPRVGDTGLSARARHRRCARWSRYRNVPLRIPAGVLLASRPRRVPQDPPDGARRCGTAQRGRSPTPPHPRSPEPCTYGGEDCSGSEMGFGVVALTDFATRIAAGSVEVSQPCRTQTICAIVVGQCVLDSQLCATVRIDGREVCVLCDPQCRGFAVDRACRRKHYRHVPRRTSGIQQTQHTDDIVAVVLGRVLEGLAHACQAAKCNPTAGRCSENAFANVSVSRRSPSTSGPHRTNSRWPVERSSYTTGRKPAEASALRVWLPMFRRRRRQGHWAEQSKKSSPMELRHHRRVRNPWVSGRPTR